MPSQQRRLGCGKAKNGEDSESRTLSSVTNTMNYSHCPLVHALCLHLERAASRAAILCRSVDVVCQREIVLNSG